MVYKDNPVDNRRNGERRVFGRVYSVSLENVGKDDLHLYGGKAVNLGVLVGKGLNVPAGYAVSTLGYLEYIRTKSVPIGLCTEIEALRDILGGRVAIRSSATIEDGNELSLAGVFESYYVNPEEDISEVIEKIYSQATSGRVLEYASLHNLSADDIRLGLVVQKLINPTYSGVIYTDVNNSNDDLLVQYVDGFGSTLVDGEAHGTTLIYNSGGDKIVHSVNYELRPVDRTVMIELARVVKNIKEVFPEMPQDIEFGISGQEIYVLQSRPLTRGLGNVEIQNSEVQILEQTKCKLKKLASEEKKLFGVTNPVFTNSNFIELLPNPTEMDFSVFAYVFTGSGGISGAIQLGRRDMGYLVGEEGVGLMHYIGGRPYSSIARDAATYYIGIPGSTKEYFGTLVQEYLNTITADPAKGHYPEMGLYLQDPSSEDLKQRFGSRSSDYLKRYNTFVHELAEYAEAYESQFVEVELPEIKSFSEKMTNYNVEEMPLPILFDCCVDILEHLRTTSCRSFVKAARLGFYYSQRLQSELRALFGMTEDEVHIAFSKLTQGLSGSMITDVNIQIAQANTYEEALLLGQQLVGHYSSGEMLQIRHPRLSEDFAAMERYVQGIFGQEGYADKYFHQREERELLQARLVSQLSGKSRDGFQKVVASAQTYMALRETVKYYFVKEYGLLRNVLVEMGKRIGLNDGDIFFIDPRELETFIADPESSRHMINSRKQSFAMYSKLDLPNVIREKDIEDLTLNNNSEAEFVEATGTFLSEGSVVESAVVVNLDQHQGADAYEIIRRLKSDNIPIIVVATQLNLSHDPYIAASDGLIIENAGIVSHGAQRARELGRGAIGGIKSRMLNTGDNIFFDPISRIVRRLEK